MISYRNRWKTHLKHLRYKNRSVFLTWMLSYVSVLLVPVLISGIIYGATLHVVKTEINRANQAILQQMEQAIDNQFKGIERLSLEMGLNKRISAFVTADSHLSDSDHYGIYQIVNDLRVYEIANDFIENIYIYYKNSDTVISRNNRMNGKSLYQVLRLDPGMTMTYEEFNANFDQRYTRGYRSVVVFNEQGWVPSIMFEQSVGLTSLGQPGAVLMFLINRNKLLEQVSIPEEGSVLILDEDNRIIASTGGAQAQPQVSYEDMQGGTGQVEIDNADQTVVASYATSSVTGWKYVMTMPATVYHQKMNVMKQLTSVSIILCLLFGGIVTYWWLRRNYTPFQALIQSLSFKAGVRFDRGSNEYSFLEHALDSTFLEKEELLRKLNQHSNMLRSHFLQRLLKGQLDSHIPLHESLSAHDISFTTDRFSVLLLRIEHYGKFGAEEDNDRTHNRRLLQFLIANVVEEVTRQYTNAYSVELDDELSACIINHKTADPVEQRAELKRIAEETNAFITRHTHAQLTIAVSKQQEGEYGISQAFQEAIEAMEYRIVAGSGGIIYYEDLGAADGSHSAPGYFYPIHAEQQLIAFLREGQASKAGTFVSDLIDKNVKSEPFSFHNTKCLMYDLMATLQKVIAEIHAPNKPEAPDGLRAIERLTQCQTVGEMREQLYELLSLICQYINNNRVYNNNPLIDKVMKYVHEHYQDENLNISMIGEAFSMNPSYVSKLFKEYTGESLLDCISKERLAKAKQWLEGKKHTVAEIAMLVGYNDVNTFHRVFKKFEGITPGGYREMKQVT